MDHRAWLAEAVGVFALVFAGAGAIVTGVLGPVGVAAAFGIAIAVMVHATSRISGAHLNPAITLGFAATGRFPWRRVPGYVGAQLAGGTAAALLLAGLTGGGADLGATTLAAGTDPLVGLTWEIVVTFFLAFVIASVADGYTIPEGPGALSIGLAVGLGALVAGPVTGGSMNPARSLGPAIVAGVLRHQWIYLLGPALGGVAGMGVWAHMQPAADPLPSETTDASKKEEPLPGE